MGWGCYFGTAGRPTPRNPGRPWAPPGDPAGTRVNLGSAEAAPHSAAALPAFPTGDRGTRGAWRCAMQGRRCSGDF
eukprot:6293741-Pyramimonas_sp.AAC.1